MKRAKDDVDYSKGMLHSHCGPVFHDDKFYCRHFNVAARRTGSCDLVDGAIDPAYWCKLFARTKVSSSQPKES